MIYDFDIYSHPESANEVKKELEFFSGQVKIVEGLEHARDRLAKRKSLDYNTLLKCDAFIRCVNNDGDFQLEVRKLSLDELAFCCISFEERRLKSVALYFKASNIRAYMKKARVSCLERPEIFRRLKRLSDESEVNTFREIYMATQELHMNLLQSGSTASDEQMKGTSYNGLEDKSLFIDLSLRCFISPRPCYDG